MSISDYTPKVRGRGAVENPSGRFEKLGRFSAIEDDFPGEDDIEEKQIPTTVYLDNSKSIISTNDSPDLALDATLNPYRGCEHGCIYCFARPGHEYLGLSAGLDFETKIFAKPEAPHLLRKKLMLPSWQSTTIIMSGVTDPYQPVEREMRITRSCLEVLEDFRNPVAIITKNKLVTRDIDLLASLASFNAALVNMSITTLDKQLANKMEPRASSPDMRYKAVEELSKAGVPVNVMIGPVLPGLTDHEIPAILKRASEAGPQSVSYVMLRLPYGVKDLFQSWIEENYPLKAKKVLKRIREIRNGKLNDPNFGSRMTGEGIYAEEIAQLFDISKKRYGFTDRAHLSTAHFRRVTNDGQLNLF